VPRFLKQLRHIFGSEHAICPNISAKQKKKDCLILHIFSHINTSLMNADIKIVRYKLRNILYMTESLLRTTIKVINKTNDDNIKKQDMSEYFHVDINKN